MTIFSDLAPEAAALAEASGNDASAMGSDELTTMALGLKFSALTFSGRLTARCGGHQGRAKLEVNRALDLPESVLRRRFSEAERIAELGGEPNVPQLAALIAGTMNTVAVIEAILEQRQSGSALQ